MDEKTDVNPISRITFMTGEEKEIELIKTKAEEENHEISDITQVNINGIHLNTINAEVLQGDDTTMKIHLFESIDPIQDTYFRVIVNTFNEEIPLETINTIIGSLSAK